jgi:DNA-binding MarR family transcriptional regulator
MADAMDDVASVMLALSERDLSLEVLAARAGIEIDKLERIIALLEEADYVTRQNETYAGRVLVLSADDEVMVRHMLAKGREIMTAWHESYYDGTKAALSDLTPLRNGVPFERVYTEVWHFVFGIANRELVKAGLFADPYAVGRRHKGFLPFIRTSDLDVSAP